MDFIKDSAVKTVNGIKTEFAKTAKRERQNDETERQNGKTETDKTAKQPVKIKRLNAKQWNQNGETVKTVNGKTANGQTGQFWNGNGNGQNEQFWSTNFGLFFRPLDFFWFIFYFLFF